MIQRCLFLAFVIQGFLLFGGCENRISKVEEVGKIVEADIINAFISEVNGGFDPYRLLPRTVDLGQGTVLHLAAQFQSTQICDWLIRNEFDFNRLDRDQQIPLMRMLLYNVEIDIQLFERLAEISNLEQKDSHGLSCYMYILTLGKPSHFDILVGKSPPRKGAIDDLASAIAKNREILLNEAIGNPLTVLHIEKWLSDTRSDVKR